MLPAMKQQFVHLHLHTEYSLIDGIVRIKPMLNKARDLGMPAIAVTDQTNLFGMVKFFKSAMSSGVKPIIGTEITLQNEADPAQPFSLVLLCQNDEGYHHLACLLSQAYVEGQHHDKVFVEKSWLEGNTGGLIALSGAARGDIGQALLSGKKDIAQKQLQYWQSLFPNRFYLELQRTGRPREEQYIQAALTLAEETATPVVATNDVRFLSSDDFEAHEARVCIHDGYVLHDSRRPRLYTEEQYLRTPEEMCALFSDIPEAIENTVEIAKRCNLSLTLGKNYLPNFPVPEGMTVETYLEDVSQKGLEDRLNILFGDKINEHRAAYDERLKIELDVINQMGFPGYFLIVADFIQWSKNNGIPVGPGRGSGAGSLVAYALKITDLDPLKYDLLFERFLNPERVSMPDFDVDFCMEGRDKVIEYVAQHYGRESVSQIITFGTMAAKAVVRDVGRVLDHPYGFVDKIAKLIPFELGITLDKALTDSEELKERYDNDDDVRTIIDLALKLEGVSRNAGKHAGGVVISPGKLTDFTPLYCEQGTHNYVTQFDKDDVEAIGLVKFDFLGLRTLTIINWAVQAINKTRDEKINIDLIPTDDEKSFDLLKACQTTAVFQLESRGMKDLIHRLQPDCFEDIVALVALFRPGPLQSGMVDDFIDRKHGRAKVEYPHPALEPILQPTYGVILYQEQVMQIAQVLAGYSLGAADILRRAMGKKKPEEMAKQRAIFTEGALRNKVDEKTATYIFDLMEKFAGYGFNKSHSAAYALVAYQTAWLKAHFPAEFMAAVLSSDMDNTDKVVIFVEECEQMELTIKPPAVNVGEYQFAVNKEGDIEYGLGAIKGAGGSALENILACREADGPFKSFYDFCKRVDSRKVTKRVVEALIKSGAMDDLGPHRASMLATLPQMMQAADQYEQNKERQQDDLFASDATEEDDHFAPEFQPVDPWPNKKFLQYEKDSLGYYFSGHPYDDYEPEIRRFVSAKIKHLQKYMNDSVTIAGMISSVRFTKTKRGKPLAFISLDDRSGKVDIVLFSEVFEASKHLLERDQVVVIEGDVSKDDYTGGFRMSARTVTGIDKARNALARRLLLHVDEAAMQDDFVASLQEALRPHQGGHCPVYIHYKKQNAHAMLPLGQQWKVTLSDDLLYGLRKLLEAEAVNIEY